MKSDKTKWCVHCPVCGNQLEKSALSDSEMKCKKCDNIIEVHVQNDVVSVRVKK